MLRTTLSQVRRTVQLTSLFSRCFSTTLRVNTKYSVTTLSKEEMQNPIDYILGEKEPESISDMFQSMKLNFDKGSTAEAIRYGEKILSRTTDPSDFVDNTLIHLMYAYGYSDKHGLPAVAKLIEKYPQILDIPMQASHTYLQMMEMLHKQKKYNEEYYVLKKHYTQICETEHLQFAMQTRIAIFTTCKHEIIPRLTELRDELLKLKDSGSRSPKYLEYAKEYVSLAPKVPVGYRYLHDAYFRAGDYENSIKTAKLGLSIAPFVPLHLDFILNLFRLRMIEEVKHEVQAVRAKHPNSAYVKQEISSFEQVLRF